MYGVEVVEAVPAVTPDDDDAGVGEDAQVLHDGEAAETRRRGGERSRRWRSVAELVEELPPQWVGEGSPERVLVVAIV